MVNGRLDEGAGYWGGFVWKDGELERRWIPPRPCNFPGDEKAWYEHVMFGIDAPVHRLTRNQLHQLDHPGERLGGLQYGLWWGLAGLISLAIFFRVVHEDMSSSIQPICIVGFGLSVGSWATFARRYPAIAVLISVLAWTRGNRLQRDMGTLGVRLTTRPTFRRSGMRSCCGP
jgi:hypothetical protein